MKFHSVVLSQKADHFCSRCCVYVLRCRIPRSAIGDCPSLRHEVCEKCDRPYKNTPSNLERSPWSCCSEIRKNRRPVSAARAGIAGSRTLGSREHRSTRTYRMPPKHRIKISLIDTRIIQMLSEAPERHGHSGGNVSTPFSRLQNKCVAQLLVWVSKAGRENFISPSYRNFSAYLKRVTVDSYVSVLDRISLPADEQMVVWNFVYHHLSTTADGSKLAEKLKPKTLETLTSLLAAKTGVPSWVSANWTFVLKRSATGSILSLLSVPQSPG